MLCKCRLSLLRLQYVKSWQPKSSKVYPEEHTPMVMDIPLRYRRSELFGSVTLVLM
jgi:hypothetical protein